jgi:hypothetical protein
MNQLLKTIAAISETHNPSLKILVLTTLFDKRQNLDKLIRQQVQEFFGSSLVLESGCFRSLLLVTCPYLILTKALVPDL